MALHPYEEQDPYGANTGENATVLENGAPVRTDPVKRLRWATQRQKSTKARDKRRSILDRFHKRTSADRSTISDGTDSDLNKDDGDEEPQSHGRTVYFNRPLPPEAKDEDGHPLVRYPRNKIRTAKYTALSFVPKNLWLQFHNIANIYFFFIILLSINRDFGVKDPALNAAPLIIIVSLTAIKDAVEDTRRTLLDAELNNSPARRLVDWENVNSAGDSVGIWRRCKKICTLVVVATWKALKRIHSARQNRKETALNAYAKRATGNVGAEDTRDSTYLDRPSFQSSHNDDVELTPVPSPRRSKDVEAFSEAPSPSYPRDQLTVPGQPENMPARRDPGNLIDHSKQVPEKARFKKDYWKSVQVGDFVRLYNGDEVPADMVVLNTSDPDGACYVETKNLDGETNLKVRQALRCGRKMKRARDCEKADFVIQSEDPQPNLYTFNGVCRWEQKNRRNPDAAPTEKVEPITINSMLLRGCNLRNTEWVLGVVIFTGQETKIMLNSGNTPSKRAKISRDLNWNVLYNFFVLFGMCLVSAFVEGTYWGTANTSASFFEYGGYGDGNSALNGFITFWSAIILFQNLVPISLYITLEIIRTAQAFFIYSDIHMFYERLEYPCTPKSWNICDDLGQIEYVFSDKTGTLTQNVMEFKKATIGGVPYGEAYTEALAGMQKRQGIDTVKEGERARAQIAQDKIRALAQLREMHDNPYLKDDELTFIAPDFVSDLAGASGEAQAHANYEFMLALALCHTVVTERTPGNPPKIEFKAQSPDEAALVASARDCGFTIIGRTGDGIIVNIMGEEQEFTVLNTLEFNSSRKRMSAIIRMPSGKIMLFCKGADSIIYSRLKAGEQPKLRQETGEHLEMFAREGLRTLCIAQKEISESVYQAWNKEHDIAAASVEDREDKLEVVSDAIERDLTLLGGTAIEDKLQDGVPDSIALLGNAGIKLWVLTGDKVETAINIGFSCNLLNNDMDLLLIKIDDDNPNTAEAVLDKHLQQFGLVGSEEELKTARKNHEAPAPTHAVVIDGDSLRLVLDERLRRKFLLLCKQCRSVLCCRVSPAQKAAVVQLVKTSLSVITLSIGDGANDVAMIQAADVGVGIAGEEGRQAVMSADFAIAQFRYLTRLMLVHGRWNYRRMAEVISNFFYKNIVWTFALFWYQIYASFDCVFVFDYTYIIMYNLAFTSLTVIFMGIFDQDVSDKVSLAVPQLYRRGIEQKEWTQLKFWIYMIDGLYQSVIVFYMVYLMFRPGTFLASIGSPVDGPTSLGIYVGTAAVIVANTYMLLNTYRWDVATLCVAVLSLLFMVGWTGIYTSFTSSYVFFGAADQVFGTLTFWSQTLLTVIASLIPRFCVKAFQKIYMPLDIDVIREQVIQGKYSYLDNVDASSPGDIMDKNAAMSSSSTSTEIPIKVDSKINGNAARTMSEDARPIYPPSVANTSTTRNPHSQQGSDDSTTPQPFVNRASFDKPRISLDKPRPSFDRPRPSYDRCRSSMDQLRPSFEASRDMTTASYLSKVESSKNNNNPREPSRLRD